MSVATLVVSLAGVAAGVGTSATAGAVRASHAVPRLASAGFAQPKTYNPSSSMRPSAAFMDYCFEPGHTTQCNIAALADIDAARHAEGLRDIYLPRSFWSFDQRRQLRVIADHERNVRGLPSLALSSALNADAQAGATAGQDPTGPSQYSWGSNISWGYLTPLAADFGWMYDDGPNSPNIGCPRAGAPGCWGHRDNILAPWAGSQGSGEYDNNGTPQLTQLFVES
jgi:hypothetical protein